MYYSFFFKKLPGQCFFQVSEDWEWVVKHTMELKKWPNSYCSLNDFHVCLFFSCVFSRLDFQTARQWMTCASDWRWVVWLFVLIRSCSMVVLENGRPWSFHGVGVVVVGGIEHTQHLLKTKTACHYSFHFLSIFCFHVFWAPRQFVVNCMAPRISLKSPSAV